MDAELAAEVSEAPQPRRLDALRVFAWVLLGLVSLGGWLLAGVLASEVWR